jgi:hypothetical protein
MGIIEPHDKGWRRIGMRLVGPRARPALGRRQPFDLANDFIVSARSWQPSSGIAL